MKHTIFDLSGTATFTSTWTLRVGVRGALYLCPHNPLYLVLMHQDNLTASFKPNLSFKNTTQIRSNP